MNATLPTDRSPLFDADELRELLAELGARLEARGVDADAYIIGGAAMAMGLGSRRSTEDVDPFFRPVQVLKEEAAAMAAERGIPATWINDHSFAFMSGVKDADAEATTLQFGGLTVRLASPKVLLALKIAAGRLKDQADIVHLIHRLEITTAEEITNIAFDVLGEESMTLTDSRESVMMQAEEMLRLARRMRPGQSMQ